MLHLNGNSLASQAIPTLDFRCRNDERRVMHRFYDGDIGTRADIIVQLWQQCPVAPANPLGPCDISKSVVLGIKLYDVMICEGQGNQVRDRIYQSASLLFYAAVRRQINLEHLNTRIKARLCAMTLSNIKMARLADDLTELTDLYQSIGHFLTIPKALAPMTHTYHPMDRQVLDTAIHLLVVDKEGIFFSSTLLYSENEAIDPFDLGKYLKDESVLFKNNAKEKLKRLVPGQKLLFPILSTSLNNSTQRAADGHFSAVLAVKTTEGYHFTLFDSNSPPDTNDNKSALIKCLIGPGEEAKIITLRQPFQYSNDCGLHTYNFFKLCLSAHYAARDEPKLLGEMFENYIVHLETLDIVLQAGRRTTSSLLRFQFVLDCMINGYVDGLQDRDDMLELLYKPQAYDMPVVFEKKNTRPAPTLWNNLRTHLRNVFPLTPAGPGRKGNNDPAVTFKERSKKEREKDREQEHGPA